MKKALKIILIIIGVLAVIAGGLFLTYKLKFDPYRGTDKVFAESMQLDEEISVTSAIQDMEYVMDISNARDELGYEPKFDYLAYLNDYKYEMSSTRFVGM